MIKSALHYLNFSGFKKLAGLAIIILTATFFTVEEVYAQNNIQIDECNCLAYPPTEGIGQFEEIITFSAPTGGTYTLSDMVNFFDVASAAPPAAPTSYMDGETIPETSMGVYSITGKRVEGAAWSVIVNNGAVQIPLNSFHVCSYPDTTIFGDLNNCIGSSEFYNIDLADEDISSIQWTLSGGGGIMGASDVNNIEILWGTSPGIYQLTVVVEGVDGGSISGTDCMFTTTVDIELVSESSVTMACNNNLNLSVSGTCELMVTPEMFLEDIQLPPGSYDVILTDIEADTIIPGNMIFQEYIGKQLQVKVIHECSYNSCWGFITLQDYSAPPLTCPADTILDCDMAIDPETLGFPVPASTKVTKIDNKTYMLEGFDTCGDGILTFNDESVENLCAGPYSAIITRTWTVSDEAGNTGSCSFNININRAEFDAIVFPEDYDDEIGTQPSLEACGDFARLENNTPSPSVTGEPTGAICINAHVHFDDKIFPKCEQDDATNTYKVWRKWTVTDLCPGGRDSVHTQIITVRDRVKPVVTVAAEIEISTDQESCGSIIELPIPEVEECSSWEYTVYYRLKDENGIPSSTVLFDNIVQHGTGSTAKYIITDIPGEQGEIWVTYSVVDACNNVTTATTEIKIIDREEPIAICDQFSYVTLDEAGEAMVGTLTFDDKSWDNCGIQSFEVRRMETSSCGITNGWAEKVKFCCTDVGAPIMVSMRVTDFSGNSNSCMVEVNVQDYETPKFTSFPNDTLIACGDDITDLTRFGFPTGMDNCQFLIVEEVVRSLNECGLGEVLRKFTIKDDFGNQATMNQVITISNDGFFTRNNITFPNDVDLQNGCRDKTDPEDLPAGAQRPIIRGNACTNAVATYSDQEFLFVEGACAKIIREWTVVDWCQYNGFDEDQGKYVDRQIIKINNSIKPTIECRGIPESNPVDNCLNEVILLATATDDCTLPANLKWTYGIDIFNDGSINKEGLDNDASSILPYGTHKIIWTAEDDCGNIGECINIFTLDDNKAPTPVCYNDIVTVIMEQTGSVEIWASDFNKGSYDNCGITDNLQFSFSSDIEDKNMLYTCAMLNGAMADTFAVDMYVTDPNGNQQYCSTTVIIQDNQNYCGNAPVVESLAEIKGSVLSVSESLVAGIELSLISSIPEFGTKSAGVNDGLYAFKDLEMYHNYKLSAKKNGDFLEGVTTLDIVLIQRHILGLKEFQSPYQYVAADANASNNVSASDIIQLRKLILGIYPELPENKSWRIFKKEVQVADPFSMEESVVYNQLDKNVDRSDFVAIKIGDVDNSLDLNARNISTRAEHLFSYHKSSTSDHEKFNFSSSEEIPLDGFQMALSYDADKLSFHDIESEGINIDDSHYSYSESREGVLSISWSSQSTLMVQGKLFNLIFTPKVRDYRNALFLNKVVLSPEIYTSFGQEIRTDNLSIYAELDRSLDDFEVYQNNPNPFRNSTNIGFFLPDDDFVTLKVYDLTGKLLVKKVKNYKEGYNEIELDSENLGMTGLLYYQIETRNISITKRMIVLK